MSEMVLPGVYIEVRPEGLIVPGQVGVGTIGSVGTASRGPLSTPIILGSFAEARERFGPYDAWQGGGGNELTLVRALELAYAHGATNVVAVRVSGKTGGGAVVAAKASRMLPSASGECVNLRANTPGTWGNSLTVNVAAAEENPFIEDEVHAGNEGPPITLGRTPVVKSARTRIEHFANATGVPNSLSIIYDDNPNPPKPGEVKITRANGQLAFGTPPDAADSITASYMVDKASAVKISVRQMRGEEVVAQETYTVVDGNDLIGDITRRPSMLVEAVARAHADEHPSLSSPPDGYAAFSGGDDGAATAAADYREGFDLLLNEEAHIMVAAGQDDSFGDDLDAHCQTASTDAIKRDRIGVVGSARNATLDTIRGHTLASDRIVFVAPGIRTGTDDLPGGYAAAAIAGLLAGFQPHISLTNKTIHVDGLQTRFTSAALTQLLESRVLALEQQRGFRVVRGITTSTNTAWQQITTRRIVDYAKYGVRSSAEPYIGLLNNQRVRSALRVTVNSFLAGMVEDEMLVSYDLVVGATRDEERRGIARVTMVLRPTFSIDFIKVTMFLE